MKKYVPESLKPQLRKWRHWLRKFKPGKQRAEIDALYALLYRLTHDVDDALSLSGAQTRDAFAHQWKTHREGLYLLTDPWFNKNVDRILCEDEIQVKKEWFEGKRVLDAGCGNGRWSYGFSRLGAQVTAVDQSESAIEETRLALREFDTSPEFHVTQLESLDAVIGDKKFDLVFSWGVLHHCQSFTKALEQVLDRVDQGGLVYIYLYGQESRPYAEELEYFKERVIYNNIPGEEERHAWLKRKAGGDQNAVHNFHDVYAPLVNRRHDWNHVRKLIEGHGFSDVKRTVDHTELFIRAVKGDPEPYQKEWFLPRKQPPFWFRHHG